MLWTLLFTATKGIVYQFKVTKLACSSIYPSRLFGYEILSIEISAFSLMTALGFWCSRHQKKKTKNSKVSYVKIKACLESFRKLVVILFCVSQIPSIVVRAKSALPTIKKTEGHSLNSQFCGEDRSVLFLNSTETGNWPFHLLIVKVSI